VQGVSYTIGNRIRSNVAALADEVSKNPVLLSLLQILQGYRRKFGTTQTTSKNYGDYGVISSISELFGSECDKQGFALLRCEPIADPDTMLLGSIPMSSRWER